MNSLIELNNVSLYNKSGIRLKGINISINCGEKIALIGSSGAGKTTLLKLANGTIFPTHGEVRFNGLSISKLTHKQRLKIGTLWQDLRLIEELSVCQNINAGALGRHNVTWSIANLITGININECSKYLRAANLPVSFLGRNIRDLSSGQKQRVAISRLLIQRPEIILADEPLSNLDQFLANKILNTLLSVNTDSTINTAKTCIISVHQLDVLQNFTRVIGIRSGQVVIDCDTTDLKDIDLRNLYN